MDKGDEELGFKLGRLRQPAAIWRTMVREEPYLARYEEPSRRFGTLNLISRIDIVLHAIADRGGEDRAGLSFVEAARLEKKLADARKIVLHGAYGRTPPTREASLTPETVVVCAACWRLAAIATQRGFRGDGFDVQALCAAHSPALRAANGPALRAARRRMVRISALALPVHVSVGDFASIVAEGAGRRDDPSWAAFLEIHFPRVARAYPSARANVRASLTALDGPDRPEDRRRLHDALIPVEKRKPRSAQATSIDVDLIPRTTRSARRYGRGASLLYIMLRTRELWLTIEETSFHGGARRGAGRPRKRTAEAVARVRNTRSIS